MLATCCRSMESVTTPSICDSDILWGLKPGGRVTCGWCLHGVFA